jgi:hypothetical protein
MLLMLLCEIAMQRAILKCAFVFHLVINLIIDASLLYVISTNVTIVKVALRGCLECTRASQIATFPVTGEIARRRTPVLILIKLHGI